MQYKAIHRFADMLRGRYARSPRDPQPLGRRNAGAAPLLPNNSGPAAGGGGQDALGNAEDRGARNIEDLIVSELVPTATPAPAGGNSGSSFCLQGAAAVAQLSHISAGFASTTPGATPDVASIKQLFATATAPWTHWTAPRRARSLQRSTRCGPPMTMRLPYPATARWNSCQRRCKG